MPDFKTFYETVVKPVNQAVPSGKANGTVDEQRILMSNLLKGIAGFVEAIEPRIKFQPILVSVNDPDRTIAALAVSKFVGNESNGNGGEGPKSDYKYIFSLEARRILMGPGKEGKTELCRIFPGRNGDIYRPRRILFEIDTPAISREQAKELYGTLMRRVRGAFPRALSNGANGGTPAPSAG